MDLKSTCIVLLGLLCVAALASAAPITAADATCSGGGQLITIPEGQAEVSFLLTCPGFTLAPSVAGKTAVFMDTDGNISDLVVLSNDANGAANFLFLSDLDTGQNDLTPPTPVLITVREPNPFIVVATSATATLQFTFTSDGNTAGSTGPSETIGISPIPEPASLTLAGIGGLLLLCGRYLRKRVGR